MKKDLKPMQGKKGSGNEDEQLVMEEEDISDRTPILDKLIDRWRYIIKNKVNLI